MSLQTQGRMRKNRWLNARLSPLSGGNGILVVILVSWVGADSKNKARQGERDLISREMTLPIHSARMKPLPGPCQHIGFELKSCKENGFYCVLRPGSPAQRERIRRLNFLKEDAMALLSAQPWFQNQQASEAICVTNLQREFSPCLKRIKISSPAMS